MTCACCAASEVRSSGEMKSRGGEVDGPDVAEGVVGERWRYERRQRRCRRRGQQTGDDENACGIGAADNSRGKRRRVGSGRRIDERDKRVDRAPGTATCRAGSKGICNRPHGKAGARHGLGRKVDERSVRAGEGSNRAVGARRWRCPPRRRQSMLPKFAPTKPPMTSRVANACDGTAGDRLLDRCRGSLRRTRRDSSRWCRSPRRRSSTRKSCRRSARQIRRPCYLTRCL